MRNYENPQKTSEKRMDPRSYYIPAGNVEKPLLTANGALLF